MDDKILDHSPARLTYHMCHKSFLHQTILNHLFCAITTTRSIYIIFQYYYLLSLLSSPLWLLVNLFYTQLNRQETINCNCETDGGVPNQIKKWHYLLGLKLQKSSKMVGERFLLRCYITVNTSKDHPFLQF